MSEAGPGPVVAVVPARGGSKRIPRKNVRPFHGTPLVARTLAAARQSRLFDRIVVSTDDEEIARVATDAGVEVPFLRPPELAGDHAATPPVVEHAIQTLEASGPRLARVCVIYPGAVFTTEEDLTASQELLVEGVDYVVPVVSFPAPLERALRMGPQGTARMVAPEHHQTRTQDLEPAYHDAGQFYWGTRDAWVGRVPVFHETTRLYPVPRWRVQDIDTPEDWERAELLHEALQRRHV